MLWWKLGPGIQREGDETSFDGLYIFEEGVKMGFDRSSSVARDSGGYRVPAVLGA